MSACFDSNYCGMWSADSAWENFKQSGTDVGSTEYKTQGEICTFDIVLFGVNEAVTEAEEDRAQPFS